MAVRRRKAGGLYLRKYATRPATSAINEARLRILF